MDGLYEFPHLDGQELALFIRGVNNCHHERLDAVVPRRRADRRPPSRNGNSGEMPPPSITRKIGRISSNRQNPSPSGGRSSGQKILFHG